MVGGGAALVMASIVASLGPIPLVAGALLLWSGIVKLIVLRIWQKTLPAPSPAERATAASTVATAGERSP